MWAKNKNIFGRIVPLQLSLKQTSVPSHSALGCFVRIKFSAEFQTKGWIIFVEWIYMPLLALVVTTATSLAHSLNTSKFKNNFDWLKK